MGPLPQAWQPRAADAYPVGGEVKGTQVVPASAAPFGHLQGQSLVPQGQLECRRTMKRGFPPSPPQPQLSFSSLLHLPLPLSCLHSPNTHRLLSWVLSHHTQTHSLPRCPCPQPATGPIPRSPLLPWANESQMAACDSAMACGNLAALPSHAPYPASASPADRGNLLPWGWRLACLGLRIQTALAIPEGPTLKTVVKPRS